MASVTAVCVAIALTADVINQLTFFVDWATCLRSWAITVVVVLVLALPISRAIGRAHLELYRAKLLAEELGRTDQLTGLPNRRALIETVYAKGAGTLALVIVDIDRFKRVNDTHGHLAGDAVIQSVGRAMAADLGAFGMVARIGGEEFALLSSTASAESFAAKLIDFRDKVSSTPILIEGAAVRVTISAGVAMRREGETFERVFSEADQALYAAKACGRNRIRFSPLHGALDERFGDDPFEFNLDPTQRSA
jgi:diguanylate cyclase (GGDEF)-like protein